MYVKVIFILAIWVSVVQCNINNYTINITDTIDKQYKVNTILKDLYSMLEKNIRQNSRELKLEDFSWGLFNGMKGHLQGLQDFDLVNNNTLFRAQKRKLNVSFEFTVPTLQATWEQSFCIGQSCTINIQLKNAIFVLRLTLDANECFIDHLAYLQKYGKAKCQANYARSPVLTSFVETTVELLTHVLNTKPFEKIVKDNVNHALLQLPLFNVTDISKLCNLYREI